MPSDIGLPDLPQNARLLDFLRSKAVPHNGRDDYPYEGWELHTHPDLVERLGELATRWPVLPVYGVPVLAANGVAGAAAMGMSVLLVRLPGPPPAELERGALIPPVTDQDWYSVEAWPGNLTSAEGTRRLSLLVKDALAHAGSLAVDQRSKKRRRMK